MALWVLFCSSVTASAQSFSIDWYSIDAAGGTSTGGAFVLSGAIGQPDPSQTVVTTPPSTGGGFSLVGSSPPPDLVWTNLLGGDWNVAANWSPNFVPTRNDNAVINIGVTVTVSSPAECFGLILGGFSTFPTLTGSGTIAIYGLSMWVSGTMSGSGRTVVEPGGSLSVANPSGTGAFLNTRTLENGGTVLWTGAGSFVLNSGAVLTNRAGALFDVQNAASLQASVGGGRFDNAGTFRKSTNPGTTTIASSVSFNNSGAVEIQTGTLSLGGGGTHGGSFDVTAGATFAFAGGTHTANSSSSITGAGHLIVSGATANLAGLVNISGSHTFSGGTANFTGNSICTNNTVTISGGTANFSGLGLVSPAILNLSNGTLDGSAPVTVNNAMSWTGGTMSGSGRTVVAAGATLNIANPNGAALTTRTLENAGTVLWTSAGNNITLSSNCIITNRPGALFHVQNASTFAYNGSSPRFDNAGTFRKSANTGTLTVGNGVSFNNSGTVEIQAGTLRLAGGSATGTFDTPASTILEWNGGAFTLNAGAQFNGAGLYKISNTVTANTNLTVPNLELMAGSLNGPGAVTVSNVMNWTGGTMSGSGRTIIAPGATLNFSNADTASLSGGRTLENGGTVIKTGAGSIGLDTGAVITNRAGALFDLQSAASFVSIFAPNRIDNAGTFRKSANAGTTSIPLIFNNSGTVEILTGTLSLGGGGTNSGSLTVPAGATLNLSGGTHTAGGGSSITGAGQFTVSGATANLAGLVNVSGSNTFSSGTANLTGNCICTNNTVTISGGTANFSGTGRVSPAVVNLSLGSLDGTSTVTVNSVMNWTGGSMNGSGRTIIPPGVTLNAAITVGASLATRTLENGGTILWTGAGGIQMSTAVITNRPGALFHVQNAAQFQPFGVNRFDNAGTFRKSTSTGITTLPNMSFNNSGTVDIRSGILAVSGSGSYNSTSNALLNCALGGATAGTGYGQLQVAGTVTLNGALSVDLTNDFSPALNDSFTVLTAGTRNGTFSNFFYPSNVITMQLSNTPSSVILRVTDVLTTIPRPMLLPPELTGPDIKLTWTTVSNTTYRLEFNPNLVPSNWNALAGDVIASSNTASKLDPLTPSNRLYRVRVLP